MFLKEFVYIYKKHRNERKKHTNLNRKYCIMTIPKTDEKQQATKNLYVNRFRTYTDSQ